MSSRVRDSARVALASVAALSTLAACGTIPRQLVQDSNVTIVSPADMATVSAPVHLRWRSAGLPAGTRFAVFVDTYPLRPGAGLRSLVSPGDPCLTEPGCPDSAWLRTHGVVLTSAHRVEIADLPTPGGLESQSGLPVHQVVIVLVDRAGRRLGDKVYSVEFRAAANGPGYL